MPISQGLGSETGTTSPQLWSMEPVITEPKFKRKGRTPPFLMEEW